MALPPAQVQHRRRSPEELPLPGEEEPECPGLQSRWVRGLRGAGLGRSAGAGPGRGGARGGAVAHLGPGLKGVNDNPGVLTPGVYCFPSPEGEARTGFCHFVLVTRFVLLSISAPQNSFTSGGLNAFSNGRFGSLERNEAGGGFCISMARSEKLSKILLEGVLSFFRFLFFSCMRVCVYF